MTPEIWTMLLILNKFLVYLGIAGAIGGGISMFLFTHNNALRNSHDHIRRWQISIAKYALVFISIGLVANAADFFVQTGNMSETGVSGMFDSFMLKMLWVSAVGTITVVRTMFLVLSALMMLTIISSSNSLKSALSLLSFAACTALIAAGLGYSFTLSGHTNELAFGSVTLITLHVVIAFAWLGSLIPLVYATSVFSENELYSIMTRFGHYAAWLVTLLLAAGAGMLIQLIPSINKVFTTPYGLLFIAKITLVLAMLGFAVWHKLYLVPRLLQHKNGHLKLKRSIMLEAAVGVLVLIATSVVTTAVGPSL
jgi:putative copper resistance protein D